MLFGKPKPTVTSEDQEWIEDAFIWFEEQYGRDYLKSLKIIEPTKEFFDHQFTGTEADAEYVLKKLIEYMDLKGTNIELYYFSESPMEFEDEGIVATQNSNGTGTQDNYALGTYSEGGPNKFEIGLELSQLKDPQSMIATLAHELSLMVPLGEGRLEENDEEVAAYALALFNNYQNNQSDWHQHLNKSMTKLYKKNLKYLQSTRDELRFK